MKVLTGLLCCLVGIVLTTPVTAETKPAPAAAPKTPPPTLTETKLSRLTVPVSAVNHKKRTITFKDTNGTPVELEVAAAVRNLKRIKAGDLVTLEYLETMVLTVAKPAERKGATSSVEKVRIAPPGGKPITLHLGTVETSATVAGINHENRVVNLKLPNGVVQSYFIPRHVKDLETVKKGDQVAVRYTKAVCIKVSKTK